MRGRFLKEAPAASYFMNDPQDSKGKPVPVRQLWAFPRRPQIGHHPGQRSKKTFRHRTLALRQRLEKLRVCRPR
jgi:hypothetical protein